MNMHNRERPQANLSIVEENVPAMLKALPQCGQGRTVAFGVLSGYMAFDPEGRFKRSFRESYLGEEDGAPTIYVELRRDITPSFLTSLKNATIRFEPGAISAHAAKTIVASFLELDPSIRPVGYSKAPDRRDQGANLENLQLPTPDSAIRVPSTSLLTLGSIAVFSPSVFQRMTLTHNFVSFSFALREGPTFAKIQPTLNPKIPFVLVNEANEANCYKALLPNFKESPRANEVILNSPQVHRLGLPSDFPPLVSIRLGTDGNLALSALRAGAVEVEMF